MKILGSNRQNDYSGTVIVEMSLTELANIIGKQGHRDLSRDDTEIGREIKVDAIFNSFKRINDQADLLNTIATQVEKYAEQLRGAGSVVESAIKVGPKKK